MNTTEASRPELHLCIATGQNLANLIPALQCGAKEVWVLQTPAMRSRAGYLADALKRRGIAVQRIDFADADVGTLHAQALAVAERLDGRAVTINLSGGTKLMTLALVQTLAELAADAQGGRPHLLYTDTTHDRLDWLSPAPISEPMASLLRLDDVLFAQGYRQVPGSGGADAAERQRAAGERQRLTSFMGQHARELGRSFGVLNALSDRALRGQGLLRRLVDPVQYLDFAPGGRLREALGLARELGLLQWDGAEEIVFASADAAVYLRGGWAEEYVAAKLRGSGFTDDKMALQVEQVDSKTRNEIDAVAVHGNRMLLLECKTARPDEDVMEWIYKSSQLAREVGGSFAQAVLVSARDLTEAQRRRARDYQVHVIAGPELATLPEYLRRWKQHEV